MRIIQAILPALLIATTVVQAQTLSRNKAFKRGEQLEYRVHYGLIDAGEATIRVTHDTLKFGSNKTYHVVGTGSTKSAFDWFFKVRDRYDSWMDEETLLPHFFLRRVDEGGFIINQDYNFYQTSNKVKVKRSGTDKGRNTSGATFEVPDATHDIISAFYYARSLDLTHIKPGDVVTVQTFFDEEVFPMQVKFIGRETIKTKAGKIRCIKIRPMIQEGRVFKEEEDLTMWVSDDMNRVPVRLQADVLVGSIKMDLKGYSGLAHTLAVEK
ncbi:MAG: DUF3108 domain-containing protein [Bacteroidetes bacterium]|nr:DUF3108 domain-containing protein [Bacteroidota bacterium]